MRMNTLLAMAQGIADRQNHPVLLVEGAVTDMTAIPADLAPALTGEPTMIEVDSLDEAFEIAQRIKDIICPPGTRYQFIDLPAGHDVTLRLVHQNGAMETYDYNLLVGSVSRTPIADAA